MALITVYVYSDDVTLKDERTITYLILHRALIINHILKKFMADLMVNFLITQPS